MEKNKYYIDYLNSSGEVIECHAALSLDDYAAIRTAFMYLPAGSPSFVISQIENAYTIRPVVKVEITKTYYED